MEQNKLLAENTIGIHYGFWQTEWAGGAEVFTNSAKRAASLGFKALELAAFAFYDMSRQEMDKLKAAQEEIGIEFSYSISFPFEYDISSPDATIRKNGMKYVKQILENIGYMGGKALGGITYSAWHAKIIDTKQAHWDRSVECVKEIIKTAEDYGITYCFETVNRFENFLINDHREAIRFAKEVGSPNAKILLDTFHMNVEEDSMEDAILETADLLGYFHVGENNRKPPGTGTLIDWDKVFAALVKAGYEGWVVMEPFVMPGGQVGDDIGVYREIMPHPDLDAEAKKALNFVSDKLKNARL